MTLHRLSADWGEGSRLGTGTGGGIGGTANNGDATWLHRVRPNQLWTTQGGDFAAIASASANVGASSTNVTWTSSQLAADIQTWLANPSSNFGWLLKSAETVAGNARGFTSSESTAVANRPSLTIDFSPPVQRTPGDLNNDTRVDGIDLALLVENFGRTVVANDFDAGEFTGDGRVGVADLIKWKNNQTPSGSPVAVPEPSSASLAGLAILACAGSRSLRTRSTRNRS